MTYSESSEFFIFFVKTEIYKDILKTHSVHIFYANTKSGLLTSIFLSMKKISNFLGIFMAFYCILFYLETSKIKSMSGTGIFYFPNQKLFYLICQAGTSVRAGQAGAGLLHWAGHDRHGGEEARVGDPGPRSLPAGWHRLGQDWVIPLVAGTGETIQNLYDAWVYRRQLGIILFPNGYFGRDIVVLFTPN